MKFKGNLVDPTAVLNVLSALEKLGSACIMNLSKTKIDFFMSKEFTKGDECFVDVTMSSVFENISISSLNDDQIPLLIDIGNLMRAVRSATSAVACTVKLTKKMAQPCLTFELQRSQHDHSITIQDVPVKLESIRRLVEVAEPDLPPPDVKVLMPKLRVLARVLDKMKTLSDELEINASESGDLDVSVRTDLASVCTYFKDLRLDTASSSSSAAGSTSTFPSISSQATVRISAKKLTSAMHCTVLNPRNVIACLIPGYAFVMHARLDIGSITYYVPCLSD